ARRHRDFRPRPAARLAALSQRVAAHGAPDARRVRPRRHHPDRGARRMSRRPAAGARRTRRAQPPRELATIIDLVRHAVSCMRAAKVAFAHGTTDPVAEAAFLVGEALHLPPERFDAFSRAHVTAKERAAVLKLIDARVRTRKP